MINLTDLWIGDLVSVISSGKVGKFRGMRGNKALIEIDGKQMLYGPNEIALFSEKIDDEFFFPELEDKIRPQVDFGFGNKIDLHLDKLPGYNPASGKSPLDFQIFIARKFIEQAINKRFSSATIIHGRGEGILRDQILHLLKSYEQVKQHFSINNNGALEIIFMY